MSILLNSTTCSLSPYCAARRTGPIDLNLAGNEGPAPPMALLEQLHRTELLSAYPSARALEADIAQRFGVAGWV